MKIRKLFWVNTHLNHRRKKNWFDLVFIHNDFGHHRLNPYNLGHAKSITIRYTETLKFEGCFSGKLAGGQVSFTNEHLNQPQETGTTFLLHALYFLSGFTALGLQLVWMRMFTLGIGHELISVLAIISAFFGGLALGSFSLDAFIARSPRPSWVYATLEGTIGLWGIASLIAIPSANRFLLVATGVESTGFWHACAAFFVPFLALLPATFCMGATLPAIERLSAMTGAKSRPISGLYGANTLGAALGVLATVFVFTPRLGYSSSLLIFAITGLLGALIAVFWKPFHSPILPACSIRHKTKYYDSTLLVLFFSGLLGIGFEVVCTRALSQAFEDSVYTYALILLNYLLGTALGALVYRVWPTKWLPATPKQTSGLLLCLLGTSCLCGTMALLAAESVSQTLFLAMNQGKPAHLISEFIASALVFLPPTMVMGALFSHLAQLAKDGNLGLGNALAVNTLGGALAPIVFGVFLLPFLGIKTTLIIISLGYACLIMPWRLQIRGLAIMALPLSLLLILPWFLVTVPPGYRLISYYEGAMSTVAVLEDEHGMRSLKTDNRFYQGGTGSITTERMKSHLPILLHPAPTRGLWIGLGTGVTFGAATDHSSIRADAVELDPGIMAMLPSFVPQNRYPYDATGRGHRIYTADARRFVRTIPDTYDIIVADFFQPNHDGAATLYTMEHFRSIQSRLKPGGLFCQWLPLYQLDDLSLRIIIKTFLEVYPQVRAYLGNFNADMPGLALVGSDSTVFYPSGYFTSRVADEQLRTMLTDDAITDDFKIAAFYLGSRNDLETFIGRVPLNTDDHPRVMYINPGFSLSNGYTTYGRLQALLDHNLQNPADWAGPRIDSASIHYHEKLNAVFKSRNLFMQGTILEYTGSMESALNLYLQSAALSPNFTVGYAKCLLSAMAQAKENPIEAKNLLKKLIELRPEIEDASVLLNELFPNHHQGLPGS